MYVEKTSTDGEMRSLLAAVKPLKYVLIVVLSHLLFRSHRFRNIQVEVLYQRYFLRMNQNNIASLLVLLICISIVLILVNHVLYTTSESFLVQVSYPQFFFFQEKKNQYFLQFFYRPWHLEHLLWCTCYSSYLWQDAFSTKST